MVSLNDVLWTETTATYRVGYQEDPARDLSRDSYHVQTETKTFLFDKSLVVVAVDFAT